eukprot:3946043-Pyramimonas_sp.AAC.1
MLAAAPELNCDANARPPRNIKHSLAAQDARCHGLRDDCIIDERALGARVAGDNNWGHHNLPVNT